MAQHWATVVRRIPVLASLAAMLLGAPAAESATIKWLGGPGNSLAEISHERRNGYSWLGSYASRLLRDRYPAWQRKWAPGKSVL